MFKPLSNMCWTLATDLNSLLPDGRIGVCEAVNNMREYLGVNCCLVEILNELLHLDQRPGKIHVCQSVLNNVGAKEQENSR